MAREDEIESFLKDLRMKINLFDIAFRRREKNLQALAILDITPKARKEAILSLVSTDYCSGPITDADIPGAPDYYVFGKTINGVEVYIKLNPGKLNKMVDCISFHPAENPLSYPLKP